MKRQTIRITLLAVLLVLTPMAESSLAAQNSSGELSIGSVAELAASDDPRLILLQRNLDAALERLGWEAYRDDLALALRGSASGATLDEFTAGGTATVDLAVEVLPQITITGGVVARVDTSEAGPETPYGASVGIILDPLADTQRRNRDALAVRAATVELESTARSVAVDAVGLLLDAVRTEGRIPLLESAHGIAGRWLEQTAALAERDRATTADVSRAREALRVARQAAERGRLDAERARLRLAQALRMRSDEIAVPDSDELDLEGHVTRIRVSYAGLDTADLVDATEAVGEARINLESVRIAAAATRTFTPELSASAAMTFPGPAYSLGLSLEVRPSDWDRTARAEAGTDVAFAERSYESTLVAKELDLRIARLELDQAFEDLEAAQTSRELVGIDLDEARFLFERGDATALEVSQSELDVAEAEYAVTNARAAVVSAWLIIDFARF